jgi:hypothetical protein
MLSAMSLRADYDPRYFLRFLLIAIGCLLFAGWCFYDALVKYPAELVRSEVYWSESNEYGEKYTGMERTRWREVVAERNWPTAPPEQPDKLRHSITSQYFYAAICGMIGIPCLIKWFRARGTWVEGSETKLTTSWGDSFRYQDVVSVDKTKWQKKGVARIQYETDGTPGSFVFDDFKYQRATMSEILARIEAGLSDDQINGGERESVIRARRDQEQKPTAASPDSTDQEQRTSSESALDEQMLEEDSSVS